MSQAHTLQEGAEAMAATMSRQKLVSQVVEQAPQEDSAPKDLPLFEQLVYSLCREDAEAAAANIAFEQLKERFFDFNEIRVSTAREVSLCFEGLSDPRARALRLISLLQDIFEATYGFDFEALAKKGAKTAQKQLARYKSVNDFSLAWIGLRGFAEHTIPVDSAMRRCAGRIGLVEPECAKDTEETRVALETLIPQAKAVAFVEGLQLIGVRFCHEQNSDCTNCPLKKTCPESGKTPTAPVKAAKPKAPKKPR